LQKWNSKLPNTVKSCVHDMVKAQVVRRPNAEAIHSWDGELTYKQLDGLSTRLGYSLTGLGVRPGVIVPLCFDKSAWAVVSMLAVMKAGGACLSMNPTHPISRLQEIMIDSSANVIVVAPKYSHLFQGLCQHVVVVKPEAMPGLPSTISKKVLVTPKDPVFIVNTSGSTGKPKSVVTEHGALSASIRAHGPALRFESGLRVLQFAAYTFDIR
jgi:non-ribosomal peptide synthetase component F